MILYGMTNFVCTQKNTSQEKDPWLVTRGLRVRVRAGTGQREHTHGLPVPILKVLAEWEAPGVSGGGEEWYVLIIGLGIIGASLGKGTWEAKASIEEPLELILVVLWWANGAGA